MKIAVVAANGRVAQKVVKEAQKRGFDVRLDAKVNVGCFGHDNPSFKSIVTRK